MPSGIQTANQSDRRYTLILCFPGGYNNSILAWIGLFGHGSNHGNTLAAEKCRKRPSSSPFAPRKQRNFRGAKGDIFTQNAGELNHAAFRARPRLCLAASFRQTAAICLAVVAAAKPRCDHGQVDRLAEALLGGEIPRQPAAFSE